jgi:hypothetical protein
MWGQNQPSGRIKTALFVDFDNIYLGLKRVDPDAAERFATEPERWLAWIAMGMPGHGDGSAPPAERDVLVRACYLNPRTFYKYRPYFTQSAFEVVDCPSLTSQGKTSSDIRMVMGILDALEHRTRFDEFIILSGDADFTPVLLRLRTHDRRTVVLAVGYAARAYKAACDRAITEDTFLEHALGIVIDDGADEEQPQNATEPPRPDLLDQMAGALYEEASGGGELLATQLPGIYRKFAEFRAQSDWLGFRGLRPLTEELVRREPALRIVETGADNWRVATRSELGPPPVGTSAVDGALRPAAKASGPAPDGPPASDLRAEILACVQSLVARWPTPVPMATASHEVHKRLGNCVLETHWAGAGSFKTLLLGATDLGFEVRAYPSPGYLYDPERHTWPVESAQDASLALAQPGCSGLMQRIHHITGAPKLTSGEYALLFEAISHVLGSAPFHLHGTSKSVRNILAERLQSISRASVTFVLRGILYSGCPIDSAPNVWTPQALGHAFRTHVLSMCNDAQVELAGEERDLLDEWLLGGLAGGGEPAAVEEEDLEEAPPPATH